MPSGPKRRKNLPIKSQAFDWRDPLMPVIRSYRMPDGTTRTEVDPDYERRYREHMMSAGVQPGFRDDPTYDMKRTKK